MDQNKKSDEILYMPFNQMISSGSNQGENQNNLRKNQNAFYQEFNRKRNAVRIDRYFIFVKTIRMQRILSVMTLILIITIFSVYVILTRKNFISFATNLKETMLYSSSEQILSSLWYVIDEPLFFTSIITQFIHDSQFQLPTKETALDYAKILTNGYESSSDNVKWWKIGIPSGTLIALYTNQTLNISKWYISDNITGSLYSYILNSNFYNESYPYGDGDYEGTYNASSQYWYEAAITARHTTWTNLYFSSSFTDPVFSSVGCSFNDSDGSVEFVIALDLSLEYVQQYLKTIMPSSRESRLAITSSDGFVVAVAGIDESIEDIYSEGIITKTIDQLEDPVWQCITQDSRFRSKDNLTIECTFDENSISTYRLIRSTVVFSDATNWTIHIVLKADEVVQTGLSIYNNDFIISSVICFVIWLIVFIIVYGVKHYLSTEQTRLLLSKSTTKINNHVKQIGILQSFEIIKNIISVHENNKNLANEMNNAVQEVITEPNSLFFNKNSFAELFDDPKVRNKILNFFCININDIGNNSASINLDSPTNYNSNNQYNTNKIDCKQINDTLPQLKISSHFKVIKLDNQSAFLKIKMIGLNIISNSKPPLFMDQEFENMLMKEISLIPQNLLFLCADSVDFFDLISKNRIKSMIYDQDMLIAIYIMLISFHISMSDRMNENLPYIRKLFLIDSTIIFSTAKQFLKSIQRFATNHPRFCNIHEYVNALISICPISKHIEIFDRCKAYMPFSFHSKIIYKENFDLMKFIFIASSVSIMIGPSLFVNSNLDKLYSNSRGKEDFEDFKNCLKTVYMSKLNTILKQILGSTFSRKISQSKY